MPNKRNAVGSPSRAMGKKRRTANRTGGQIMQNEEITQKKDGAGRRRIAKKKQGVGHVVAEGPVETTDFSSGLENVVSGNGVVYRWVTLGPPPPHLIEGRPTPANRWGANWSIGLENVVSGNGVVYRWVTLGPPPPHLIEGRPTPANRWGANWSIGNTSVFPGHSPWPLVKFWRENGIKVVWYLDDGFGISPDENTCYEQSSFVKRSLDDAGFLIKEEKSVFKPVTELE
ncbi:Hypothetical predicted protein [Mytilus galloprovincialis]|uniref:Uncharacterized protein n=1 Tax=Mytilus galloprovincialis TaxID=29158 RepID=A0A8B6CZD3_MYTGA|nr:Hypothetical predicted protein [Mytilus galloprovincialis]